MNEYAEEEEFLIHNTDCDDPVLLYKLFVTDHIQCINNSAYSSKSHQRALEAYYKS